MTPQERKLLDSLSQKMAALEKSDRYTFIKPIQMLDGRNMQFGKTTGTKMGISALEKIGFWGVTPIVQSSAIGNPSGGGDAGVDSPARSVIISILTALRNRGDIAT